jgi:hypothetical protein
VRARCAHLAHSAIRPTLIGSQELNPKNTPAERKPHDTALWRAIVPTIVASLIGVPFVAARSWLRSMTLRAVVITASAHLC